MEIFRGVATLDEEFNKVFAMNAARFKEFSDGANNVDPQADVIISVDAECFHNRFTTWGCYIKDKEEMTTLSHKEERISVEPTLAEALEVRWSLELSRSQQWHKIVIQTDALVIADYTHKKYYVTVL